MDLHRAGRGDQRLHRRVPDPEPDPLAGRRRRARRGVRADLQRAADEAASASAPGAWPRRSGGCRSPGSRSSPASRWCSRRSCSRSSATTARSASDLARVIFPTVVHARPERAADRDPERARRVLPARHRARRLERRDRRHARAEPAVPAHDRQRASTRTRSASCSARSSSSRSRTRRCAASAACAWFCDPRDEAVQRVFALMLPVTLGLGLINLNLLVNTWFAASVDHDIGPAAVDKAFRIYMLPQGMFSVAVAAVLFPALSRRAAARDGPGFRALRRRGPAPDRVPADPGGGASARRSRRRSCACSTSTATSRRTTRRSSRRASPRSRCGLAFNGAMLLLNRAFFSMQRAWVPTYDRDRQPRPSTPRSTGCSRAARSASGASRSPPRSRTSSASRSCTSSCARSPAGSTSASSCARSCASSSRPCSSTAAAYGVWRGARLAARPVRAVPGRDARRGARRRPSWSTCWPRSAMKHRGARRPCSRSCAARRANRAPA